tara:strand:- start:20 stop:355 length:336 start_codon:yes stop_codon:yes gene_type:complete
MRLFLGEKLISKNVSVADTMIKRMVGLLQKESLLDGESLLIEPCNSIHTFFMRFNIDVIFLDKNFRIIKIFRDMPPWRMTMPALRAKKVIEANANAFKDLNVGDQLELRDV